MQTIENPIIVALDVPDTEPAVRLVKSLTGSVGAFKVGLELFNAVGPSIFDALREAGGSDIKIFYDPKLHDIPNTVAGATYAAAKHNLWMINVHTGGGSAILRAVVDAAKSVPGTKPLVIGVTLLTSISAEVLNNEIGIPATPEEQVLRLAKLAQSSGCDGVVASPHEVPAIRAACGPDFLIVTPGVRPVGADINDQKRIMTPADAIKQGSNYLVIGRPITQASDPKASAEAILAEIRG